MNADAQEQYRATPFDPVDRNRPLGEERTISAWTRFRFDGRGDRYSSMQWHWYHFDGVDHNTFDH